MKLLVPLLFSLAVAATPFFAAQAETAATTHAPKNEKPDLIKGAALFAETCVQCHNADGNSSVPTYPKIAGQYAEYTIKQLMQFKDGMRADPIMQGFASMLSEDDIRNIAYWAASQKPKLGYASNPELVAEGERIFRGGIPDRNIAACAACHSPTGAGIPPVYPSIAGQHADYIRAELEDFRASKRTNNLPMVQIAAKMNDREILAVSDYIAGLRSAPSSE